MHASTQFAEAIRLFDAANSADPNHESVNGVQRPRELVYAERLTDWVVRLSPDPSEVLRLAARCQHLCRWEIPRQTYPEGKAGYLKWRNELKQFHARRAGEILKQAGYSDEVIAQVQALNLKKNFPTDSDSLVLEDALCLVFLQYQFAELAARTDDEKMINALQKSWKKMSPAGHAMALQLNYGPHEKALLERALQ